MLDNEMRRGCMLRLMAAAAPDAIGFRALLAIDVFLFAQDALRYAAEEPTRHILLAWLKEQSAASRRPRAQSVCAVFVGLAPPAVFGFGDPSLGGTSRGRVDNRRVPLSFLLGKG